MPEQRGGDGSVAECEGIMYLSDIHTRGVTWNNPKPVGMGHRPFPPPHHTIIPRQLVFEVARELQ